MTHETTKHVAWTAATVAVVLALRTWAIREGIAKRKALRSWDIVSERMRLATRRATTVQEWTSMTMRTLQIGTVDAAAGNTLIELAAVVGGDADAWLTWVEDEHQFIFALAREQADRKKASRQAAAHTEPPEPTAKRRARK